MTDKRKDDLLPLDALELICKYAFDGYGARSTIRSTPQEIQKCIDIVREAISPPVPDDVADASKILGNLVAVWQSLPAGNYSPDRIQSFMYDLKSIVDEARTVIRSDNKSSIPNAIVEAVKWAKSVKELSDIRISGEEFYADDHAKSKHLETLIRAASTPPAEVRALQKIPLSASTSGDFITPDYIKGWNAAIEALNHTGGR